MPANGIHDELTDDEERRQQTILPKMVKKRAKTGDKGLYASRAADEDERPRSTRRRSASEDGSDSASSDLDSDYLALEGADSYARGRERAADGTKDDKKRDRLRRKDDEFTASKERAVFDLGGDESSDGSDSDDGSSDGGSDDDEAAEKHADDGDDSGDDDSDDDGGSDDESSDDESADDDDDDESNADDGLALQWGRSKKRMYGGDVADLEIGQDVQDAYDEETAVQELIQQRNKAMRGEDFMGDYGASGAAAAQTAGNQTGLKGSSSSSSSDSSSLRLSASSSSSSSSSALTVQDKVRLLSKLSPATVPLLEHFAAKVRDYRSRVGPATEALRKERDDSTGRSNLGTTELGFKYLEVKGLSLLLQCLNGLVYLLLRGAEGGEGPEGKAKGHPVVARLNELQVIEDKIRDKVEKPFELERQLNKVLKAIEIMKQGLDEDDDDEERSSGKKSKASKGKKSVARDEEDEDEEDEDEDDDDGDDDEDDDDFDAEDFESSIVLPSSKKKAALPPPPPPPKEEVSKKGKQAKKSSNYTDYTEKQDDDDGLDDQTRAALKAMKADLAGDGYGDEEDEDGGGDGNDDDDEEDGLYEAQAKKAAAKKAAKKAMYEVKPKFPTVDTTVEGERAIGRIIMKNRGLVAHKPKINRNPRVKKREQYRKALIKRKGAVREVRTGETDNYGGEGTGIKAGVSRSRMFT